jgi:PIN domain nuclease of toxin-antitoxin system
MNSRVIDSSAILALIFLESGAEKVAAVLEGSLISTVNVAEVFTKLAEKGLLTKERISDFYQLGLQVADLDEAQALKAAELRPLTRGLGLSLGDRCCLALAFIRDASVVTADRNWQKLKFCKVDLIR